MKSISEDLNVADNSLERRIARADAASKAVVDGFYDFLGSRISESNRELASPDDEASDLKIYFSRDDRMESASYKPFIVLTVPLEGEPMLQMKGHPPVSIINIYCLRSYLANYQDILDNRKTAPTSPDAFPPDILEKLEERKKQVEAIAPSLKDHFGVNPRVEKMWFAEDGDPNSELFVLFGVRTSPNSTHTILVRAPLGEVPTVENLAESTFEGRSQAPLPIDRGPFAAYYSAHYSPPLGTTPH